MSVSIQLTGDWRKLRHAYDRLDKMDSSEARDLIRYCAEIVQQSLEEVVTGYLPPSNAQSTVNRKGFDNPMTETGAIASNIIIKENSKGDSYGFKVQGSSTAHSRSNTPYEQVFAYNEDGGAKIPGREAMLIAYSRVSGQVQDYCIKRLSHVLGF